MGVISILLGIIAFIAFTGAGAILGNSFVESYAGLAKSFTSMGNISNTGIMIAFIAVFGFIGLLVGMNLIMHGLTYRKVCKIAKRRHSSK